MTDVGRRRHHLIVTALSRRSPNGWLRLGNIRFACALGRTGCRAVKREGDGATPLGRHRLLGVLYRPDGGRRPRTGLPVRPIRQDYGWCDASGDRNYNREVRLPYPVSHERLWREDRLYDLVVVIDYNVRSRRQGAGSAIFMHIAREGFLPTEGCIALSPRDLRLLLVHLRAGSCLIVR